jgi:hypothetical protein
LANASLAQQGPPTVGVNVVNPATSPARTSSVDDPGRIPYQVTHRFVVSECFSTLNACFFTSPAVPAGKRLVIQHIAVSATLSSSGTTFVTVEVRDSSNIKIVLSTFNVPVFPAPAGGAANAEQAVQFFLDAGSSFKAFIDTLGTLASTVPGDMNITGYLLDCTVNVCAPIAP